LRGLRWRLGRLRSVRGSVGIGASWSSLRRPEVCPTVGCRPTVELGGAAEESEVGERGVMGAVGAGGVAIDGLERGARILPGEIGDLLDAGIAVMLVDDGFGVGTAAVEGSGLEAVGATNAPGGLGHVVDEFLFDAVSGIEAIEIGVEQVVVGFGEFVVKDDVFVTGEAVFDGVAGPSFAKATAGRALFAGGGDGAS